ncbi:putative acyltransferase [Trichinella spiralis]|uniref:putative acyltransferase n=1 Tax=Trichinella spiralis TaxID=6334 RepID=UPI0001EFC8F5|nr:putative acyltransferase [Trichinella spiralis]
MENSSEDPAKKTLARLNQLTSIATAGSSEAPNIFKTDEHYTLESTTDSTREIMLAEFQRRKRARMMTLPTDDYEVKALLRQLGHPICLFGEDKPDRRERLRKILSLMAEEEAHRILRREEPAVESQEDETTWYHEGSEALKSARIFIAQYSLPRAKERLLKAREQKNIPGQERAIRLQETHKWISVIFVFLYFVNFPTVTNFSSQIGDVRPVVYCDFSPDSKFIATAGWSGLCKIWSVPDCKLVKELRGHSVSACCVRFHPKYEENHMLIGSCDQEGRVKLWSMNEEKPLLDIDDCAPYRVSRLAFHPSGRFIAYTWYFGLNNNFICSFFILYSFDCSWRLYDVEVKQEILYQEGHSKSVYDIAFQCDGSVALTGGLDAYGRVWDLRTGRCVMFLESHQRSILTVDFLPNGMVRYVLYWVERLYQLKIIVRGASHLESSQPLIVVCNHQSSLDIIPMMRIWPERCAPLAKKSLKYMGFFGIASILCGCVFIDRFDKNNARKVISSTLKHIIEQKIPIVPVVFSSYRNFYSKLERRFDSVSPDDCKAVGFTPNLVCSSCSELSQYGLKELEPNCRQCCAKDELYDAINQLL